MQGAGIPRWPLCWQRCRTHRREDSRRWQRQWAACGVLMLSLGVAFARRVAAQDTARTLPTMKVRSRVPLTEEQRRLDRAKSLGGRIVSSKSIRAAAPTSRTLGDLMRRTAGASVQVVAGYAGSTCLLVQRTANLQQEQHCALLVVDEVVSNGDAYITPTDVELIVVIPASAAVVRFGERARHGAVAVYTRSGGGS